MCSWHSIELNSFMKPRLGEVFFIKFDWVKYVSWNSFKWNIFHETRLCEIFLMELDWVKYVPRLSEVFFMKLDSAKYVLWNSIDLKILYKTRSITIEWNIFVYFHETVLSWTVTWNLDWVTYFAWIWLTDKMFIKLVWMK